VVVIKGYSNIYVLGKLRGIIEWKWYENKIQEYLNN